MVKRRGGLLVVASGHLWREEPEAVAADEHANHDGGHDFDTVCGAEGRVGSVESSASGECQGDI